MNVEKPRKKSLTLSINMKQKNKNRNRKQKINTTTIVTDKRVSNFPLGFKELGLLDFHSGLTVYIDNGSLALIQKNRINYFIQKTFDFN